MAEQTATQFDLERIVADTFVEDVRYLPTVDSTNNAALELCRQGGLMLPLLVVSPEQTAGRGRGANRWWSAAGALTFSLVIDAADCGLPQQLWPRASLTAGLSVCLALEEFVNGSEVLLKWPNDVHLGGRKVSGVLVEPGPAGSQVLVVGVGVNVNNSFDAAPRELQSTATSLIDATGAQCDLTQVLNRLLGQLDRHWARLAAGDANLAVEWKNRCALTGRTVEIESGRKTTTGVCEGIDEEGALLLRTEGGSVRLFSGVVTGIW